MPGEANNGGMPERSSLIKAADGRNSLLKAAADGRSSLLKTTDADSHHHYPKQQAGKRHIRPVGAFGLNLRARSCLVGVDEEYALHVTGSLLVLQSLDEIGKFTVLPEYDKLQAILGIHQCETLPVLAVCGLDWDGKCLLVLYHTAGLRVGDDVNRTFRKARTFELPISDPHKVAEDGVTLCFSPAGKTLIAIVDSVLRVIDWQRNKIPISFHYPGGKVTTVRFDPVDHTRISLSGRGFLKLWRIKHSSVSPLSDIQGLKLHHHEVVDHLWLYDGTAVLMATRQGRFACLDINSSKQRYLENILGIDDAAPTSLAAMGRQAFVVMGEKGRIALLRESDHHAQRKDGHDRVVLVRLLNTNELTHEILGGYYVMANSQTRLVLYSSCYIGTMNTDKLFKKGLEEGPPNVEVELCREFHSVGIYCIAVCARKPLIATCTSEDSDVSVRVWSYQLNKCMIMHQLDKAHRPSSVAFHPSGNQLLVSLEDRVQIYQVMEKELRLAYEVPLKGALRVPNTKNFFVMTKVNSVAFNHGGSTMTIVTGKVIQLFSFYSTFDGLPAREYVLAGHANDVISVVWALDDLRLFSASRDTVMEWRVGQQTRVRETVVGGGDGRFLGLTLTYDGTLMAPCVIDGNEGEPGGEKVVLRLWPGTGNGQNNIEQPCRNLPLPELVTCVVSTCNAASEANGMLVDNVVIAGTQNHGCQVLELHRLPPTDQTPPPLLRRSLHPERTTAVARSVCGEWLFMAAADGALYACELRLSKDRSRHDTKDRDLETNELLLIDEAVTVAERAVLLSAEAQIQQLQADLVEQQSINNYQIESATQEREKLLSSLKEEQEDSIKSRDHRINELEETVEKLKAEVVSEVREREAAYAQGAAELELQHQKKLTASAMQYKKLKDAFNDLVVAAKDDSAEAQADSRQRQTDLINAFDKERAALIKDQEILRGYADYLKKQYTALLDKEDRNHDDEVLKFKALLEVEKKKVAEAGLSQKSEMHLLQKEIAMLQQAVTDKDDKYIDLKVKMEHEVRKCQMLERKIKEQEKDIANHVKTIEKWESKAGEQEHYLSELGKTRNVLLAQLRDMRDVLPKKEKELAEMKARLQEIDLEYGKGLQSRAELDKKIIEQSRQIKGLQQELIQMQRAYAKKENVLDHVREEIRDLVNGRVVDKTELNKWRERLREYLPCLEKDSMDSEAKEGVVPLTPADLAIADQARQKVFLQRDLNRLTRKLDDSQGVQSKLVKVRTLQNNILMHEMNKLRRYNRKLEMKLRESQARYDSQMHRLGSKATRRRSNNNGIPGMEGFDFPQGELGEAMTATFGNPIEAAAALRHPSVRPSTTLPSTERRHGNLREPRSPAAAIGAEDGVGISTKMPAVRASTAAPKPSSSSGLAPGSRSGVMVVATPDSGKGGKRGSGSAGGSRRIGLAEGLRGVDVQKEAERANMAEAALDVVKTENAKLVSIVTALSHYLKSLGHDVTEIL